MQGNSSIIKTMKIPVLDCGEKRLHLLGFGSCIEFERHSSESIKKYVKICDERLDVLRERSCVTACRWKKRSTIEIIMDVYDSVRIASKLCLHRLARALMLVSKYILDCIKSKRFGLLQIGSLEGSRVLCLEVFYAD